MREIWTVIIVKQSYIIERNKNVRPNTHQGKQLMEAISRTNAIKSFQFLAAVSSAGAHTWLAGYLT